MKDFFIVADNKGLDKFGRMFIFDPSYSSLDFLKKKLPFFEIICSKTNTSCILPSDGTNPIYICLKTFSMGLFSELCVNNGALKEELMHATMDQGRSRSLEEFALCASMTFNMKYVPYNSYHYFEALLYQNYLSVAQLSDKWLLNFMRQTDLSVIFESFLAQHPIEGFSKLISPKALSILSMKYKQPLEFERLKINILKLKSLFKKIIVKPKNDIKIINDFYDFIKS